MSRVTIATVNAALRKRGAQKVTLHRGKGYFYFVHDDGVYFDTHSVYVYRLNTESLESWIDEGIEFYKRVTREERDLRTGMPIRLLMRSRVTA